MVLAMEVEHVSLDLLHQDNMKIILVRIDVETSTKELAVIYVI